MGWAKPVLLSYVNLSEKTRKALEHYTTLYEKDSSELERILPQVEVVLGHRLDTAHLKKMQRLRMIQSPIAGVDNLPWEELPEHVLVCANTGANAENVAEHVWAFILAQCRNLHTYISELRRGIFDNSPRISFLSGKILGVVGMGSIGRRVAEVGKAFHMKVYGVTKSGKSEMSVDFLGGPESLEYVLGQSDVLVLSAPLTKTTRGMIDLRRLNMMKKNCVLVNVGRAGLISREDLLRFLEDNPEFRVATDVWWNYGEEFGRDAEFMKYPNFIGTPWIAGGWSTPEFFERMVSEAAGNIIGFLRGERPRGVVDRTDYV